MHLSQELSAGLVEAINFMILHFAQSIQLSTLDVRIKLSVSMYDDKINLRGRYLDGVNSQ